MSSLLQYDGSFDGFLTCVFDCYEYRYASVNIVNQHKSQLHLFADPHIVVTDEEKANRVRKGLQAIMGNKGIGHLYRAFLSENDSVENLLFSLIKRAFTEKKDPKNDFGDPNILKVSQLVKNVRREKHRMEAFVRFRLTKDGWYFASIEPDFNVLPLIISHFKNRYADQKWMIYDLKRNYGVFYDLKKTELMNLDFEHYRNFWDTPQEFFAQEELDFQSLWKEYFKSTNIESRKNMKLHVRHVPKRYWKYLSEKQG